MRYKIEFDLPDNDTVLECIGSAYASWGVWGYSGYARVVPVDADRKTGKWVGADSQCGIGCPFCGAPVDDFCSSIDYIDLIYEPNFCPNCGARLKKGEDV